MKTRLFISLSLLFFIAFSFMGAGHTDSWGPIKPTYFTFNIPAGWPRPAHDIFASNRLSEEGFQLGRKLFYDGRLSKDGNFPCASCHQPFAAFSTYDHDFSHGFNNAFTARNAPPLFNLAWMPLLHWDGSINHLEVQPLAPINNVREMAENTDSVLLKLKKDPDYRRMFKAAFGDNVINSKRMLKALAMFTGTILSANSKYDKVQRGEASFTEAERRGYIIYKEKCAACHPEPLFTDFSFRNNGLPLNPYLNDIGRMKITGDPRDSLKFKVPSLRNLRLTFPYMHDGRIYSLSQVIDHYQNGIQTNQPTLDSLLRKKMTFSSYEKNCLTYFLYTLTDTSLAHNPRFGPPERMAIKLNHPSL
jgi:cytochrome c peroxidase